MAQVRLASCTVDLDTRQVEGPRGKASRLTHAEVALLRYLLAHPDQTLSRENVLREVWEYRTLETRTLDTTVARLRRKIERDLSLPDHLHTVRGVGYRWVSGTAAPSEDSALPSANEALVGRATELKVMGELVASGRVTTLKGPGGVGKSVLARALLRRFQDEGKDAFWVEAGPSTSVAPTLSAVAKELGIADSTPERLEALVGRVLAARPPCVMVFDNIDRIAEALGPTLTAWIAAAPHTAFLSTSRSPTGIADETVVEVSGLPPEEGARLLEARARAAGTSGPLDPELLRAVSRALDGIPLLLQLVARQVAVMPLSDVLARLQQGVTLLRSRRSGGRHDSAEACVAWSWESLTPDERRILRAVASFDDGFALETVEEAFGADAGEVVLRLVEHSLITRVDGARGRFRLFHYVREFVLRQAVSPTDEQAMIEALVARCERHLIEGNDASIEVSNLLAAHPYSASLGRADLARRIALVAGELVWFTHGPAIAETLARNLVQDLPSAPPSADRVKALAQWSRALRQLGRRAEGQVIAEQTYAEAEALGQPALLASIALALGIAQAERSVEGLTRARELFRSASVELARLGDDARAAVADLNLAMNLAHVGEVDEARAAFLQALERAERCDGPFPRAGVLFCFAAASAVWGEFDDARARAKKAVTLLEGTGRRLHLLRARGILAQLLASDADVPAERIIPTLAVMLQASEEIGVREQIARAHLARAIVDLSSGRVDEGIGSLIEAREAMGPSDYDPVYLEIEMHRAIAELLRGTPGPALGHLDPLVDSISPEVAVAARALSALSHRQLGDEVAANRVLDGLVPGKEPRMSNDLLRLARQELERPERTRWRIVQALARSGASAPNL